MLVSSLREMDPESGGTVKQKLQGNSRKHGVRTGASVMWQVCISGGFTAVLVQASPCLMLFPWCCGLNVCVPLPN